MFLKTKWQQMSYYRRAMCFVFILALSGVIASLLAQYVWHMNPCVMCIQQRLSLIAVACVSLVSLLLPLQRIVIKIITLFMVSLPSIFGLYIAAQQAYLQTLPLSEQPSCGAPLTFRLRHAWLFDWYEPIIRGSGKCGEIYRVLGISLPIWSIAFFGLIVLLLWLGFWQSIRKSSRYG